MFKYYISEVEGGGGSRPLLISLMQGGGIQNLEKCADIILERSLILVITASLAIATTSTRVSL